MKSIDLNRIWREFLPSIFFAAWFGVYAIGSNILIVNVIAGFIALALVGNLFLRSVVVGRIFGILFFLGSVYFSLAMLDDFADGEASYGYLFGLPVIIICIALSVLMIIEFPKIQKNAK